MKEITSIVMDAGGLVILAVLFIYSWVQDRTKNNKTLEELSKSNNNIAEALTVLKISYDLQREELNKQNTKLEIIHEDIKSIKNRGGKNYGRTKKIIKS